MPESVAVKAPAKLNLALSVGPAGDDGMHPICSWMITIDLCDELRVSRLDVDPSHYAVSWHDDAKRRGDIDWSMTRDLAALAHRALEQYVDRRLPVQMKLEKQIPVGGGLGGGSSDAAAMLRATNDLFELGLTNGELCGIAAGLGSDVSFFVGGGSAVVHGFGERVVACDAGVTVHAVVAFPDTVCRTGRVYAAYDTLEPGPVQTQRVMTLAGAGSPRPKCLFNDLADAAVREAPQLAGHLSDLSGLAERPVHVAGSGSSLFVLCDDELHATHLAGAVEERLHLPAIAVRSLSCTHDDHTCIDRGPARP